MESIPWHRVAFSPPVVPDALLSPPVVTKNCAKRRTGKTIINQGSKKKKKQQSTYLCE